MKILNLKQGTPEWAAHRAKKRNASDAPAMAGESPHCTRTELLHRMATGITPDVDAATQARFNDGHAVESLLRQLAAKQLGEPLHPFVGVADFDERYSASFDGCTFLGDITVECKLLNARLRAAFADMEYLAPELREREACRRLPMDYQIQMEQQVRVGAPEAERVLFMAGELRTDGTLGDVFSCWYYPADSLWATIQAGWDQFEADLAAYVPPAASAVEKIVAEPVEALPAPVIQVSGQLTLQDNFKVFEQRLRDFLEKKLIREPKTDQDFADLDGQIKAMKQAREALKAAEAQMLAQVQPVDQAKKTKDMLDTLLQQNVSMAERLLSAEKDRRKGEIVAGGVKALQDHVAALNERLGKPYMPQVQADFGGAVKGLKSLASMEDKVKTELARAKIAANEVADRIDRNLKALREHAKDHAFLFADTPTLVLKAPEDCLATITARIAQHKAAEEERLDDERARIREEEEAKARAAAQAELEAEQRRQREAQEAAEARAREETVAPAAPQRQEPVPLQQRQSEVPVAPAPTVVQMPVRQAPTSAPAAPPTLRLGQINERLTPLSITEAGLAQLGFPAASKEARACLYHEASWPLICQAITRHIEAASQPKAA